MGTPRQGDVQAWKARECVGGPAAPSQHRASCGLDIRPGSLAVDISRYNMILCLLKHLGVPGNTGPCDPQLSTEPALQPDRLGPLRPPSPGLRTAPTQKTRDCTGVHGQQPTPAVPVFSPNPLNLSFPKTTACSVISHSRGCPVPRAHRGAHGGPELPSWVPPMSSNPGVLVSLPQGPSPVPLQGEPASSGHLTAVSLHSCPVASGAEQA